MFKLKKRQQFQKVYKKGLPFKGKNIAICLLSNLLGYNRIGISIDIKKALNSVRRNRIKRILSEAFRLTQADMLKKGYDIVLVAKKDISAKKMDDAREELVWLYKKADILI